MRRTASGKLSYNWRVIGIPKKQFPEIPKETLESDGEPMENDVGEETMSDMCVRVRDSAFISPGRGVDGGVES